MKFKSLQFGTKYLLKRRKLSDTFKIKRLQEDSYIMWYDKKVEWMRFPLRAYLKC